MKVEYIKPFAQAAFEVLKDIVDVPLTRGKLSLLKSPVQVNEVCCIIGFTGDVEGRVLFDMETATAKKIAELMNYEEFDSFNQLCKATISELANIIAGRAVSMLCDSGFAFRITPPILMVGSKMETSDMAQETIVIPLESSYGTFSVNVAIKNGKS